MDSHRQREYKALQVRYEALSRDWNKHRDVDRAWRRLERFIYAASVVACLAALGVISGVL